MKTAWLSLSLAVTLAGQSPPQAVTLSITGDIPRPVTLTADELAKMPRTSVAWSERGPKVTYQGVLLYEVLKHAGAPLDQQLSGQALSSYVVAEARDGYQVLFSLAEIDPAFSGNQVLIADTADGQTLAPSQGPLRLVVGGDKKGARAARMLERLTVVRLRK
ncbi:MAG: molybdopterin-dependent oxidoreductase [Acidobacteriia bacterium]|nr:molybdopterin-dependent oxidoreductase [Terriglobia bacterium]